MANQPGKLSDEWFTPLWILEWLPRIALDPFWSEDSHVGVSVPVGRTFDIRRGQDAGTLSWNHGLRGIVFMNPPYNNCSVWIARAAEQLAQHPDLTIVMLIPAIPGERYWHKYIWRHSIVLFLNGRVKFDTVNGTAKTGGNNGSALVVMGKNAEETANFIRSKAALQIYG